MTNEFLFIVIFHKYLFFNRIQFLSYVKLLFERHTRDNGDLEDII